MLLRGNGDAKIVEKALQNHDFEKFIEMYKKYPPYFDEENYRQIFFPDTASVFDRDTDTYVGELNILNPESFNMIDGYEFECG